MTLLQHPSGYAEPCVTIRRWQMFSTEGNLVACALLGVFEVFHYSRLRAKASQGEERGDIDLLQHHTNRQLIDRINHIASDKTVREAIKLLETKGFITIEKNPSRSKAFDRTRYFLFHPEVAQAAIDCYLRSMNPESDHSVNLPNGVGNKVAPCGKSTESSLLKRSREISLREEPENFSEQPEEPKPSPVNQPPIVETTQPTTAKEKTTPQPPSAEPPLNAQIRAVYERCKPPMWVSSPTWTTSLEVDIMRVLRDIPDRDDFLGRIEIALKFAGQDFALSKKTGTIGDLFKYGNLVEWSDKGRSVLGAVDSSSERGELRRGSDGMTNSERMAWVEAQTQADRQQQLKASVTSWKFKRSELERYVG